MRITIDPATHALNQTGSPAAILFIAVLIAVRTGARAALGASGFQLDPFAVTDLLMALALGLFAAQRSEMYLRGKRLLDAAVAR